MAWGLLLLAGLVQIGWMYAVKASNGFRRFWPVVAYMAAGAVSSYCLSHAMQQIALAVCYSVWMGIAIAGAALIDHFVLKHPANPRLLLFVGLIVAGVVGLKVTA